MATNPSSLWTFSVLQNHEINPIPCPRFELKFFCARLVREDNILRYCTQVLYGRHITTIHRFASLLFQPFFLYIVGGELSQVYRLDP